MKSFAHFSLLAGAVLLFNACSINLNNSPVDLSGLLDSQALSFLNPRAAQAIDATELIAYTQDLARLKRDFGGLVSETDTRNGSALLRTQGAWTSRLLMKRLYDVGYVDYAEPNIQAELPEPDANLRVQFQPNDSLLQTHAVRYPLELLQAEQAWDLSQGSENVTVAVIDTGVDPNHPDLQGKLVPGYDFVNEDNDPSDDHGHGTHVAGIIAAHINNGLGIAGLAPKVKIMPLKALNENKGGKFRNAARAIRWATEKGAQVINLSLAGNSDNNDLREAIQDALAKGVVVVSAMGNDQGQQPQYPAFYSSMGLISVGAVGPDQQRARFSNYGSWMSVVAPGVGIVSTTPANNREGPCVAGSGNACYTAIDGTSQASPYVAALAALLRSQQGSWSPAEIKSVIEQTALDLGANGVDDEYGHGLIQPLAALRQTSAQSKTPVVPQIRRLTASPFFIRTGETVHLKMQLSGSQPNAYGWATAAGKISGNGPEVEWTAPAPGNYQIIAGAQAGKQPVFAAMSVIVFEK